MTQPDLLLLDEPHSALDADAVDLVEALVARTSSNGGAAILVSHDRGRVTSMATRTVEIAQGTIT
jgi:ATPase subunit of ABC transporter with duplicated ATPase domains